MRRNFGTKEKRKKLNKMSSEALKEFIKNLEKSNQTGSDVYNAATKQLLLRWYCGVLA